MDETNQLPDDFKSLSDIKILTTKELSILLNRRESTIKVDAHRRPESLPPRLKIPHSNKHLWIEADVLTWINEQRRNGFLSAHGRMSSAKEGEQ